DVLYTRRDQSEGIRARLRDEPLFARVAEPLSTHFLALTMVQIERHQRRILYFAYDDSLWDNNSPSRGAAFAIRLFGRPRSILLTIPPVGDADSYHFEVTAPEGLQVTTRSGYVRDPLAPPIRRPVAKRGSFQRSHVHFPEAAAGDHAVVVIKLRPR